YLGGGIEEYLARREAQQEAASGPGPGARTGSGLGTAGAQRAAKKEMQRLERQIDRLAVREEELTADLAASASDYEKLIELGAQLRAIQEEKASLEERWLEAAETSGGSPREPPGDRRRARGCTPTTVTGQPSTGWMRARGAADTRPGTGGRGSRAQRAQSPVPFGPGRGSGWRYGSRVSRPASVKRCTIPGVSSCTTSTST